MSNEDLDFVKAKTKEAALSFYRTDNNNNNNNNNNFIKLTNNSNNINVPQIFLIMNSLL